MLSCSFSRQANASIATNRSCSPAVCACTFSTPELYCIGIAKDCMNVQGPIHPTVRTAQLAFIMALHRLPYHQPEMRHAFRVRQKNRPVHAWHHLGKFLLMSCHTRLLAIDSQITCALWFGGSRLAKLVYTRYTQQKPHAPKLHGCPAAILCAAQSNFGRCTVVARDSGAAPSEEVSLAPLVEPAIYTAITIRGELIDGHHCLWFLHACPRSRCPQFACPSKSFIQCQTLPGKPVSQVGPCTSCIYPIANDTQDHTYEGLTQDSLCG